MKPLPVAKYAPPAIPSNKGASLEEIYNYGKVFVDACNYANITEEQGLKFLERFSKFKKSE